MRKTVQNEELQEAIDKSKKFIELMRQLELPDDIDKAINRLKKMQKVVLALKQLHDALHELIL